MSSFRSSRKNSFVNPPASTASSPSKITWREDAIEAKPRRVSIFLKCRDLKPFYSLWVVSWGPHQSRRLALEACRLLNDSCAHAAPGMGSLQGGVPVWAAWKHCAGLHRLLPSGRSMTGRKAKQSFFFKWELWGKVNGEDWRKLYLHLQFSICLQHCRLGLGIQYEREGTKVHWGKVTLQGKNTLRLTIKLQKSRLFNRAFVTDKGFYLWRRWAHFLETTGKKINECFTQKSVKSYVLLCNIPKWSPKYHHIDLMS